MSLTMKVPEEQREHERVHLMFHAPIIDCATQTSIGVLADISLSGMRVVGEKAIPAGEELLVRLKIPVETEDQSSELLVSCQSRWSRRVAYINCFHTGFKMTCVGDPQSRQLATIIEEFGISQRLIN